MQAKIAAGRYFFMLQKIIYQYLTAAVLAAGLTACVPLEQQQGYGAASAQTAIRYEDYIYHQTIRTVQCYVATGVPDEVLQPPVISLRQERPIRLEFDRVNAGPQRLLAKLVHCNADWTPSGLNETQYLNEFNEFFITDVQNSVATRVPYVHYKFQLPRVKISGNYLLQVQEEGGALLLTRRILVYQELVSVVAKLGTPLGTAGRQARQPVEFNIFYNNYPLVNPVQEVKTVMRQNHRWDNARFYPRPTFVRDEDRRLEYVFFEPGEHFLGLSEFRPFDFRSVRFNGIGVTGINLETNPVTVQVEPGRNRQGAAYSQDPDINGKFIINNREFGQGNINGDYAWVNFLLKTPEEPGGNVYIQGALSDWQLSSEARMRYDASQQGYVGRLFLKQGYYNYYFAFKPNNSSGADASFFEGSHFQTGNTYDILVYYRPPGTRFDMLIGYEEIIFNRR